MSGQVVRALACAALGMSLVVSITAAGPQVAPSAAASLQYRAAAEQAVKNPFRVNVHPAQQGISPGSSAVLKVQICNANNEAVNADEKMSLVLKTISPGGKEQTHNLEIASGSDSGQVTIQPDEAGLWRLEVRDSGNHLASGSSYLFVATPRPAGATPRKPRQNTTPKPKPPASRLLFGPRLVLASYRPQKPDTASDAPEPASKPLIRLTTSAHSGNTVMADGIDAADVELFLSPPQPVDVQVWISASEGQVSPQPVTIKAGELVGAAQWTSRKIADNATISIKDVSPKIDAEAVSQTISFTDPVVAIVFSNPPSRLNIVERGILAVRFIDRNGLPIQLHLPLSYAFNSNSPRLHLNPMSSRTKPDALDFQASITPLGLGTVTVEATVPNLHPIQHTIQVTGLLLMILCALAGALGGLVNHLDRKQKGLIASLVTGMIVALPIAWLYVWVGLPHLDSAILHNQLSAIMVAIIGGVGGAGGLKKAASKFGLDLFDGSKSSAAGAAAA